MHPAVAEGIALFNSRRFFEAHEVLESLWLTEHGNEKLFLHGLIQVAAAFHHYLRGNEKGFCSLLEKGARKLNFYGGNDHGIDLEDFQKQIRPWLATARRNEPAATRLRLPVIKAR